MSRRIRPKALIPWMIALALGLGWSAREVARAKEAADQVKSSTVNLGEVKIDPYSNGDEWVGRIGIYLAGETPRSRDFVTGRLVLDAGKAPHPPHVHPEEEVMIIESGEGEIVNGKVTTRVGPGAVMYTAPEVPHGIVNTGKSPIVFYFIKWAPKPAP